MSGPDLIGTRTKFSPSFSLVLLLILEEEEEGMSEKCQSRTLGSPLFPWPLLSRRYAYFNVYIVLGSTHTSASYTTLCNYASAGLTRREY